MTAIERTLSLPGQKMPFQLLVFSTLLPIPTRPELDYVTKCIGGRSLKFAFRSHSF
jgi:hypothetical protein